MSWDPMDLANQFKSNIGAAKNYAPNNYNPLVNQLLTKGTAGTQFDIAPLMQGAEQQYGRTLRDMQTNAQTNADINAPNDPYARGFARIKANEAAGGAAAGQFGNLQNQYGLQNLNFLHGLLGQGFGADQQAYLAQLQQMFQRQMQQSQAGAGLDQMFGQLGGMGLLGALAKMGVIAL